MAMFTGEAMVVVQNSMKTHRCILPRYLAAAINTGMALQSVKEAHGLAGAQKTA